MTASQFTSLAAGTRWRLRVSMTEPPDGAEGALPSRACPSKFPSSVGMVLSTASACELGAGTLTLFRGAEQPRRRPEPKGWRLPPRKRRPWIGSPLYL